jgi:hypothetical protein
VERLKKCKNLVYHMFDHNKKIFIGDIDCTKFDTLKKFTIWITSIECMVPPSLAGRCNEMYVTNAHTEERIILLDIDFLNQHSVSDHSLRPAWSEVNSKRYIFILWKHRMSNKCVCLSSNKVKGRLWSGVIS